MNNLTVFSVLLSEKEYENTLGAASIQYIQAHEYVRKAILEQNNCIVSGFEKFLRETLPAKAASPGTPQNVEHLNIEVAPEIEYTPTADGGAVMTTPIKITKEQYAFLKEFGNRSLESFVENAIVEYISEVEEHVKEDRERLVSDEAALEEALKAL